MYTRIKTHPYDLVNWAICSETSSRTSGIIRIGLALLIWARWSKEFGFFNSFSLKYPLFAVFFFISTASMLIGFYSRFSTFMAALSTLTIYYYFGSRLGIGGWDHHHTYLLAISTLFCSLTPCGKSYSLDRYLAVKEALKKNQKIPEEKGNIFGIRLISLQLCAMYFWTAYDKTNMSWFSGEKLEMHFMWQYMGSIYPTWPGFHELMLVLSWLTLLLEYSLAFGLFFEQTRKHLLIPGIIFHCIIYLTLPVNTFSFTVILLYLSFLNADYIHCLIDKMSGFTEECH